LKTAQSGYLTRRLVDSSQNIIVKEDDCNTVHHKMVSRDEKKGSFDEKFEDRIFSHTLALDVKDPKGGASAKRKDVLIPAGTVINNDVLEMINEHNIDEVAIRSVLTCETE